jgi:group I intron endonuclease
MYTIYLIEDHGGKGYVGMTSNSIEKRFCQHKKAARKGVETHLYRAIRKHGAGKFSISCLDTAPTHERACHLERKWIGRLKTYQESGYNETLGGDGIMSGEHSDEVIRKMSQAKKGKKNPKYWEGREPCDKTKRQISESKSDISDSEVVTMVVEYRTTDKFQQEVANENNVNQATLSRWNRGEHRPWLQEEIESRSSKV